MHRYLKYLANNQEIDEDDLDADTPGTSTSTRNQRRPIKIEEEDVAENCTLVPDEMRTTPEYALLKVYFELHFA